MRQVRQRVALLQTTLSGNRLVSSGKRNRLERQEGNLFWVVESEPNDRSDLIIIDAVDQRRNQYDLNAGFVQVVDGPELYIEQVAHLPVTVRIVADAVELNVDVTQTCFGSLATEFFALRELNSIGCRLNRVVSNLARVTNCFDKVRRDSRFATRELDRHLATRLNRNRVVENLLDLFHAKFMYETDLVRIHEARIAHHVAAVRKINRQDRTAPVLDGAGTMV